jgi:DNA-binding beta-propeller fold protein YncE
LPEKNWIGVANGDKGDFELIDGASYKVIKEVDGLDDADNVRFDPKRNLIYVGFGSGGIAIIDPDKIRKIGEIKLKGHPESFQLETNGPRIFVNVPDARQITVLDRDKQKVVAEWSTGDLRSNFPMALDEKNGRLFVGCRNGPQLLVIDAANGRRVATVAIGGDTDDLFYDAQRKFVIISCGAGSIDVVKQSDPDTYRKVESLRTAQGARTSFYAPDLNVFAVAVPRRGGEEAGIWLYSR